jgi:microcystin-dependent protein|tara:strand:+ start:170 stop:745 length:576 start_codon:yes stop_codon:yes gene_type:complete
MSNYEATKYDFDGANLTGIEGIPSGCIIPWSDTSVPSGFLECNGQAVSRSTYAALFAIVATTYGAGNGSTTFNVPDLKDNVALGRSNSAALASTGGANTVSSTGNVGGSTANATLSTAQLASHSHSFRAGPFGPGAPNWGQPGPHTLTNPTVSTNNTGSDTGHSHNMSATFSGDATSVVQPYLTVLYVIKT